MKIKSLISKRERWTQHCQCRDNKGNVIPSMDTMYLSSYDKDGNIYFRELDLAKESYSFSLYGAIARTYLPHERSSVIGKLRDAIYKTTGNAYSVAKFNDDLDTRWEDVKRVIEKANV